MCSIFTVLSHSIPEETIRRAFEATKSRGPDMSRLMKFRQGWMGFHRLAIMGLNEKGMQPFERNGDLVICNGELYGFRPIRERLMQEWPMEGESDCEILLPLYYEYGLEM
ncbi:MAG: asparagine synthetase B, partial [Solobacterium sp.]|nr:asparagine synthetase B [Solobacterium sp.]